MTTLGELYLEDFHSIRKQDAMFSAETYSRVLRWWLLKVQVSTPSSGFPMSLSCSSGHKVLESPFSHAQFYGGEHPSSTALKASSLSSVSSGKRKGRGLKHKKAAHGGSASLSQATPTKPKSKKKRNSKTFSASLPIKNHSHKTSTSAVSSLAQVDCDSPASSRKQSLQTNHVKHHSTHTRTEAKTSKSRTTTGSPGTTEPKAGGQRPNSIPVGAESGKLKARYQHPDSSITEGKNKARYQHPDSSATEDRSKARYNKHQENSVVAESRKGTERLGSSTSTTTRSSLLTYSKMSTSALLLSMGGGVRGARGVASTARGGSCSVVGGGVANKKCEPRVTLPPHMRVHRLVFQAHGKHQGRGVGGSVETRPLDLEGIGKGLGQLQYHNVIVMSGAGISTSSGIPDFR